MAKTEGFYEFIDAYRHERQQISHMKSQEAFRQAAQRHAEEGRPLDSENVDSDTFYGTLAHAHYHHHESVANDPQGLYRARMFNQTLGQFAWNRAGKPYCKVFPGMREMLADTNLNLDCKFFKLPLPAIEIRFSMGTPFVAKAGDPPLHAVLMFGRFSAEQVQTPEKLKPCYEGHDQIMLLLDFGEKFLDPRLKEQMGIEAFNKYYSYLKLNMDEGRTVEQQLQTAIDASMHTPIDDMGYTPPLDFQKRILAVCTAACFFMRDEHHLIRPDIPGRFKERYERAEKLPEDNRQRQKEMGIINSERRRLGHYGWTMGHEIELPRRPHYSYPGTETQSESGKRGELKYQHYRGIHHRWQKIGPRKDPDVKLIWIMPTIVRKDLPTPPVGPRYKITDRALNQKP